MVFSIHGPWMRTPGGHLSGFQGHQLYMGGLCGRFELDLVECIEAYGFDKGVKYCSGILGDFNECRFKTKQIKRRDAMEYKRTEKWMEGELKPVYMPDVPGNAV